MVPALVLKLKPAGTVPSPITQVKGGVPPETAMVMLYGTAALAGGRPGKRVVINGNGFTVICSDADLDGSDTDVAVTVADCTVVMSDCGGAV